MFDLKVAVIGAGHHAQAHFSMIAAEPAMRLVGVAELDAERLARAKADHKPEVASTDYREMLDRTRPDVVYVEALPGHLLPIVLDCIERGIHTSVEKSPGMHSGETEQMLVAARSGPAKVIVSFNRRYFPRVLAVKQLVLARGGAVHCAATYNKPHWGWADSPGAPIPAPIISDAIHLVDLLRWLAGDTLDQAADVATVYAERWESRPGTDRHNAVFTFANGRCGVMMSHYGVGFRIQRSEVHAEGFSAYMDLTKTETGGRPPGFALFADGAPHEQPLDLDAVGGADFNETRHLVECIEQDRQPWSHLADALETMRLCEAINAGQKGTLAT
ncbi:MAG: hypothetical protein CL878_01200 [Dehalococcoidia bacterium]|nr:hypothetical protein [Dehalococcoidia bacterium]